VATGAQAVERTARVTGKSFSTVDRIARAEKQDARAQFARGAPGGGKNAAHVTNVHLVNLVFGLAADPITAAPDTAEEFGGLTCLWVNPWTNNSPIRNALQDWLGAIQPSFTEGGLLQKRGLSLLDALADLINRLSYPENNTLRRILGQANDGYGGFHVKFCMEDGASPYCKIEVCEVIEEVWTWNSVAHFIKSTSKNKATRGAIGKTITVPYFVFEAMGDLWADTRAHVERTSSGTPPVTPNSTTPENETAAPYPRQGTDAAALSLRLHDQPQRLEPAEDNTPEYRRERQLSQSLSNLKAGHPHQHLWSDRNEDYGKSGAYRALR